MYEASTAKKLACAVLVNEPIAPDVWRMRFECPELAASIEPGQFMNVAVPGDARHILRLPFSWSDSDPQAGWVEFAYLLVGEGTRRMTRMAAGTLFDVVGPAGHGWAVPAGASRALVVGGGSGVVPVVALARSLHEAGVACDFVEGAATAARVIYEERVLEHGAAFHVSTDDGSRGVHGFATAVVDDLLGRNAYDVVYTCGPTPMMRGVARLAADAGVPCQVSMERLMACGFGACTTCLVDTVDGRKSCCVAGPVFDAAEVVW